MLVMPTAAVMLVLHAVMVVTLLVAMRVVHRTHIRDKTVVRNAVILLLMFGVLLVASLSSVSLSECLRLQLFCCVNVQLIQSIKALKLPST